MVEAAPMTWPICPICGSNMVLSGEKGAYCPITDPKLAALGSTEEKRKHGLATEEDSVVRIFVEEKLRADVKV